ncbi:phospholipase D family protein [Bradyrhizobium sp. CB3481]|uniref:phospholipase D family protein n=1 Tax=Bradyrhizobium sp. CB3481 TaxID=3039158 RepID=UPI0024B1D99E|nr:phospholipase D family protein [Bradyrhizobium sp. CB3481]WFU16454.1 phospholipase D family protein [Bradyrhizobium sp. CB3481]
MLNRRSLDPEQRTLYGANLQPPAGYVFDAAVATSFSLDLETALAVPVSLALFAAENRDDILTHPLALLEGAERIAGRLLIFTDSGHIQAHTRPHSRLCSLLERIIVEVAAPNGGAFHPKIWALRFKPLRSDDPIRVRLLVLSRNLTRDRSWDIALTLDGVVAKRPQALNRPLVDLIRRLPDLAIAGLPSGARDLTEEIAEDVRRTDWSLPAPFQSVAFAVNGLGGKQWRPEPCARIGVISPFCDDQALSMLAGLGTEKPVFIGRSDELAMVPGTTLDRFGRVAVLDEMAATEDGEDADATALHGLHAKAFIAETGWDTAITVGSGNATRPALLSGSNVEVFATLTGKRSRVGGVEEILGDKGFGRLTRPFVPDELLAVGSAQRAAEARLDAVRREICQNGLKLQCERTQSADDRSPLWRVWLTPSAPLALLGISGLRVWPITRGEGHGKDALEMLRLGERVDLGAMPLIDLTCFLACYLTDRDSEASILFSTGLVIEGLPSERHAAILRWVIDSKEAFFRYLRLLLSELGDPFAAALAAQDRSGRGAWRTADDDAPLLEEMVRAFCWGGNHLRAIERLIIRLETVEPGEVDPIPAEFRTLWSTFRLALDAQGSAHAE